MGRPYSTENRWPLGPKVSREETVDRQAQSTDVMDDDLVKVAGSRKIIADQNPAHPALCCRDYNSHQYVYIHSIDSKLHSALQRPYIVFGKTIPEAKLKDLKSLLHLIPQEYHSFYVNLDADKHIEDDLEGFSVQVDDVVNKPPSEGKYEKIKSALISRLTPSNKDCLRQVVKYEELGDRKPSQLLRHMRSLGGSAMTDEMLLFLWSSRLPAQVQALLQLNLYHMDLDTLAELADKVNGVSTQPMLIKLLPQFNRSIIHRPHPMC
ncbi:hypothetical protein MSG28_008405 [Choristoneura fumiferana]|uniref:Uncharacterized protein n=1 Tax=Choristoneura fumiferana TaxID=7141 RepID=A0ACC0J5Z2_CHOFU|nr:hypothetical protein MSG28_008405 [Choristoneura fumiferana]